MAKLNIVLFEPEIPSNTGNIGRTCVATGSRLHLIEPLGFKLNEKALKRAGMDYWKDLDVTTYINYEDFLEKNQAEAKKMSIYEYDQEKHLRQEREDAWKDGLAEGERIKLKEQIRKKLAKGKSVSEIADILEEEEKTIQELIDELKKENV